MRNEKFDWFQKNRVGTANQHSIFLYTPEKVGTWWDLNLPWGYNHMPYKYHMRYKKAYGLYLAGKKVYFLIPTSEKVGTW